MLPVVCTCEKRFPNLRQKLVDGKLITFLSDDEAKREFLRFVSDVVREKKKRYFAIIMSNLSTVMGCTWNV